MSIPSDSRPQEHPEHGVPAEGAPPQPGGEALGAEARVAEEKPRYYYPNKIGRAYLLALEEVMGRRGLTAVLNLAGLRHWIEAYPPNNLDREVLFDDFAALNQALDDMYGPRGGRGLAIRAARAAFSIAYEDFSGVAGVAGAAFKLLPLNTRLKIGLPGMARVFNQFSDQVSWVKEEDDRFVYGIDRCPVCWGRKADRPICHAAVGLLREGIAWATGREYKVEEFECVAMGHPSCKFAIHKEPIK